jgi:hypothetical protein
MLAKLEGQFHRQMLNIYDAASRRCGYRPTRFLRMVKERGGVQAAKTLLRSTHYPEGLTTLWQRGCLDISMEALVIGDPWRQLFTAEEISAAERRLQELDYAP